MIYIIYSHIAILMASLEIGRLAGSCFTPCRTSTARNISPHCALDASRGSFSETPRSFHAFLATKKDSASHSECCHDIANMMHRMLFRFTQSCRTYVAYMIDMIEMKSYMLLHNCLLSKVWNSQYHSSSIQKTGEWSSMIQSPYDIWSYPLMICQSNHRASCFTNAHVFTEPSAEAEGDVPQVFGGHPSW